MNKKSYEIFGLAGADELVYYLSVGIPVILAGFFICYLTWWNKKAREKRNTNNSEKGMPARDVMGCLGMLVMLAGAIMLIPLLAWVEAILNGLFVAGLAIFIGIGLLYLLYAWIVKK